MIIAMNEAISAFTNMHIKSSFQHSDSMLEQNFHDAFGILARHEIPGNSLSRQ